MCPPLPGPSVAGVPRVLFLLKLSEARATGEDLLWRN